MLNPDKARSAGFTLVELVIVVMIIGSMAAVAVPRYADALSHYRAEATAKRIQLDLKLVRRQARLASQSRTIQFDIGLHSYTLLQVDHLDSPDQDYQVDLGAAPYASTIVSADFGGDAELVFDGYGIPDSGGTIVVEAGQHQQTISIDAASGEPTFFRAAFQHDAVSLLRCEPTSDQHARYERLHDDDRELRLPLCRGRPVPICQ